MADTQLNIVISAQDNASAALSRVASSTSMLGSVLAALGIANITNDLIQLGKAAFETGYNFQVALENIQGNTGMTNQQISQMTKEVQALGQQSGVSTTDLANAFKYAFDISKSMNDSLQITRASMEAVRVAGGDMSDATRILAITMHDYNIPADQATKTMDTLLKIVQGGAGNFADLNSQFTVLAGTASALGVPLDQTGALFDALTRRLGDANRASVEANMFLLAVADAHKSVQAAIGNTTSAVTGGTKAHKDYSDAIATATDKIKSQEDHITALENAHKKNNDTIALAKDHLKSYQDSLVGLEAKQNSVSTSAMSKVDPALRGLAGDFSDAGIKAKGIIGILQDINDASNQNSQELQKLFPNYRSLYAAMGLTADGGKDVRQSLKNIDTATSGALNSEYNDRLQKLDGQWGILSETMKNKVINAFAAAAPVMNAALKIANWDMGQTTEQKYQSVGKAIEGMWKAFSAGPGAQAANGTLAIGSAFEKTFESVSKSIQAWAAKIPGEISKGLQSASTAINNWISDVQKFFSQLPGKTEIYVEAFVKKALYDFGFLAGQLSKQIPQMITDIGTWFQKLPGNVEKSMSQTATNVSHWWSKVQSDAALKFYSMTTDVSNWLRNTLTTADSNMSKTHDNITKWWATTQSDAAITLSNMVKDASTFIGAIPGNVDVILGKLNKTVDDDLNTVWQTATKWWKDIEGIFNSIVSAAENAIKTVQKGFTAGQASVNHRAGGGYASGLTLVGESGPELLQLPTGSYVHTNSETKNMMGGAQVTIQFNGGVQMDSPDRVKQLANQIIKIIGRQNELAQRGFSV